VDVNVWAVQLVEHAGKIMVPPGTRLLQASSPLLPLFMCSSFCAQNHHRHSHHSQA
jgi:hypothetical protein